MIPQTCKAASLKDNYRSTVVCASFLYMLGATEKLPKLPGTQN